MLVLEPIRLGEAKLVVPVFSILNLSKSGTPCFNTVIYSPYGAI